ncbi:hypothetical protein BH09VER1_BH09VER1_55490 [soil metagenome]
MINTPQLGSRQTSSEATLTGGARIGWFNATWPFAKLQATPDQLTLKVTFSGTYVFPISSVIAVHKFVHIPFIGWGIRIEHTLPEYPAHIVFWYLGFPSTVLLFIEQRGFPPSKIHQ